MNKNKKKGFTLVELIVVVVIVSILASIGFISLQDYNKNARYSKRINDIAHIGKKAAIVIAKGKKYTDLVIGNNQLATSENLINYTKVLDETLIGDINFTNLGEDAKKFKGPSGNELYKIAIVTGEKEISNSTEKKSCFSIATKLENGLIKTQGNCGSVGITSKNLFENIDFKQVGAVSINP